MFKIALMLSGLFLLHYMTELYLFQEENRFTALCSSLFFFPLSLGLHLW